DVVRGVCRQAIGVDEQACAALSRFASDHQRAGASGRAGQSTLEEKAYSWRCKTHDENGPKNSALSAQVHHSAWDGVEFRAVALSRCVRRDGFFGERERGFMGKQIRIGIVGYGNLGRGVEAAIAKNPDMTLEGIFTRRAPADLKPLFAH